MNSWEMDSEEESEGNGDAAARLYEMGQQLCEMAKSMGYQEEDESEEDPTEPAAPSKPKAKQDKMGLAMSFLNK